MCERMALVMDKSQNTFTHLLKQVHTSKLYDLLSCVSNKILALTLKKTSNIRVNKLT